MLVDLQHQKHIISLHVMHGDYGRRLREKPGVYTVTTGGKYTPPSWIIGSILLSRGKKWVVIKTFRYTQMQQFSVSLGGCPNSTTSHVLANRRIKASSKKSSVKTQRRRAAEGCGGRWCLPNVSIWYHSKKTFNAHKGNPHTWYRLAL